MMDPVLKVVCAKFDGRCGLCDDLIVVDERIVCVDDEWVHLECAYDDGYMAAVNDGDSGEQ